MLEVEIRKLYLAGESTVSLAKKFNLRSDSVWRILKRLGVKTRSHSDSAKLALEKGRLNVHQHRIPSSGLTIEKAYLIGVLCGDGWLWCSTKPPHQTYQFGLQAVDEDFVDEFRSCVYKTYGLRASKYLLRRRRPWQDIFESRVCSKAVCEDLKHFLPQHKTRTWRVPAEIMKANLKLKSAFIKGFFDSEGHVETRRLGATSINLPGLKEIQQLFQDFGIRTQIQPNRRGTFLIRLQDRKSVEIYADKLGFVIKRKNLALKKVVDGYKRRLSLREDVRALEPEINKMRAKGETYENISKKLGLSIGTVWMHSKL